MADVTRCMIESCGLHAIARDAPLLLLDADADPDITDRMAPGADFVAIQSPPVADIVQVSDLTLSNSWLLHPDEGSTRRASVLAILEREVRRAAGGGVLVVATKRVLAALHGDLGRPAAEEDDEALRQPLLGAQARWFGPRTQGVNDYEKFAAIVIIGRLQPGVNDVETTARAVFSGDALPIEAHISGPLPATDAQVLLADGSMHQALMRAHPDPRVQAILAQSRECATLQAIARLRLVVPNCAKRVVILSNQPLPEFPVTRLATLAALERDLEHEPDWHGFARMERALRATPVRPVRGARLSAAGLAADQIGLHRGFVDEDKPLRPRLHGGQAMSEPLRPLPPDLGVAAFGGHQRLFLYVNPTPAARCSPSRNQRPLQVLEHVVQPLSEQLPRRNDTAAAGEARCLHEVARRDLGIGGYKRGDVANPRPNP